MDTETKRIETEEEVKAYIFTLRYALKNGAKIDFQIKRKIDEERDIRYTNRYTFHFAETPFKEGDFPYRRHK